MSRDPLCADLFPDRLPAIVACRSVQSKHRSNKLLSPGHSTALHPTLDPQHAGTLRAPAADGITPTSKRRRGDHRLAFFEVVETCTQRLYGPDTAPGLGQLRLWFSTPWPACSITPPASPGSGPLPAAVLFDATCSALSPGVVCPGRASSPQLSFVSQIVVALTCFPMNNSRCRLA